MDKRKDIVEFFLEQNHLLSPEALEDLIDSGFSRSNAEQIYFDKSKLVLGSEDIKTGRKVEIINNIEETVDNISVQELAGLYNQKYETIKNIIQSRFKNKRFVSIGNISGGSQMGGERTIKFGGYNVIGIVRGKENKEDRIILEIEDATGSLKISFSKLGDSGRCHKEEVMVDDVIGINGVIKDGVVFGEKIIYPDVPLRQPVSGYGRMCYMSDLCLDEAPTKDLEAVFSWLSSSNVDYVFIGGKIKDTELLENIISKHCPQKKIFIAGSDEGMPSAAEKYKLENVVGLSSPSMIKINGVNVLSVDKFDLSMLKKRYIDYETKSGDRGVPFKEFIISEVPDIVLHANTGKPFIENYKSITIINAGSLLTEFVPVILNLETRNYGQIYADKLKQT